MTSLELTMRCSQVEASSKFFGHKTKERVECDLNELKLGNQTGADDNNAKSIKK